MKDDHKNVVIWGLGVLGGNITAALYFLKRGIAVKILDDKDPSLLKVSLDQLIPYKSLYTLGQTNKNDLEKADIVIKNPGIPINHPLLKVCRCIETDQSLFLRKNTNPIIGITGSKGKSSLCTWISEILKEAYPNTRLGGNITLGPLSFLDKLDGTSPVVLELSSWHLRDMPSSVFFPKISLITNLYHDHQNTYHHFNDYVRDKMRIFENQKSDEIFLCEEKAFDNCIKPLLKRKLPCKIIIFPSLENFEKEGFKLKEGNSIFQEKGKVFLREKEKDTFLFSLPSQDMILLSYQKMVAGSLAYLYGLSQCLIERALSKNVVLRHRLELVGSFNEVDFYNDSAATLPEATFASSISLLSRYSHLVLITGGTDKDLIFECFSQLLDKNITWILLSGSATSKIEAILKEGSINYILLDDLASCFNSARTLAKQGSAILFSPAAASFEKFDNEFDRGNQWTDLVKRFLNN